MNEYAVVKVQVKEEHSKECLSPIVLKPWGCQPCSTKNFQMLKEIKDYRDTHEFANLGSLWGNITTRLNQREASKCKLYT